MVRIGKLLLPVIASALLLAACGSSGKSTTQASGGGDAGTVGTAVNAKLGETVLVDAQGMTLYRLTAENGGRHFICTDKTCLATWHPLEASPTGVAGLGTVKRPDGARQVTYHGMPLYTFAGDTKPGDAKGEGFKDVGVWNAVATKGSAHTPAQTTTSPGGGYGGY